MLRVLLQGGQPAGSSPAQHRHDVAHLVCSAAADAVCCCRCGGPDQLLGAGLQAHTLSAKGCWHAALHHAARAACAAAPAQLRLLLLMYCCLHTAESDAIRDANNTRKSFCQLAAKRGVGGADRQQLSVRLRHSTQ